MTPEKEGSISSIYQSYHLCNCKSVKPCNDLNQVTILFLGKNHSYHFLQRFESYKSINACGQLLNKRKVVGATKLIKSISTEQTFEALKVPIPCSAASGSFMCLNWIDSFLVWRQLPSLANKRNSATTATLGRPTTDACVHHTRSLSHQMPSMTPHHD